MTASGFLCNGPGGKALADGPTLLSAGLQLPSLVTEQDLEFFAGVETAPRICGEWAFNASAVSWFLYKPPNAAAQRDDVTGIEVEPGYMYVTYEHFADFCLFRASVDDTLEFPSPVPSTSATDLEEGNGGASSEGDGSADPTNEDAESAGSIDGQLSPSPGQTAGTTDDNPRECFPGDALVQLEDGKARRMADLGLGDKVMSSTKDHYSDVYFFSHRDRQVSATFVRLETSSRGSLSLTSGHYLYLNGIAAAAATARPGDFLTVANGTMDRVISVGMVKGSGLYNPHTSRGDIVVNGFLTTTWTTAVPPVVAHPLLAPIRFIYSLLRAPMEHASGRPAGLLGFLKVLCRK